MYDGQRRLSYDNHPSFASGNWAKTKSHIWPRHFFVHLRDAREFLGDDLAVPIVENSPLVPPPHSTADRELWPIFIPGSQSDDGNSSPRRISPATRTRVRQATAAYSTSDDDRDTRSLSS